MVVRKLFGKNNRKQSNIGPKPTLYCTNCGKKKHVWRQSIYDTNTGEELHAWWASRCEECEADSL